MSRDSKDKTEGTRDRMNLFHSRGRSCTTAQHSTAPMHCTSSLWAVTGRRLGRGNRDGACTWRGPALSCWGREGVLLGGGVRVGNCAREKVGRKVGYAPDCSSSSNNAAGQAGEMQRQCSSNTILDNAASGGIECVASGQDSC